MAAPKLHLSPWQQLLWPSSSWPHFSPLAEQVLVPKKERLAKEPTIRRDRMTIFIIFNLFLTSLMCDFIWVREGILESKMFFIMAFIF